MTTHSSLPQNMAMPNVTALLMELGLDRRHLSRKGNDHVLGVANVIVEFEDERIR